jgi:hypothetical protein
MNFLHWKFADQFIHGMPVDEPFEQLEILFGQILSQGICLLKKKWGYAKLECYG